MRAATSFDPDGRVTGIGSLPGSSFARALDHAFRVAPEVPFLPELPCRSRRDGMIDRIVADWREFPPRRGGTKRPPRWPMAVDSTRERDFEAFLRELRLRRPAFAKLQIAGPVTLGLAARAAIAPAAIGSARLAALIRSRVARLAIEAGRSISRLGIRPVVFLDEPGLAAHEGTMHRLLAPIFARLRRARVLSGVHCCAETDWEALLECRPDVLSFDAELSLASVTKRRASVVRHLLLGGSFAPGVVSTRAGASAASDPPPETWVRRLRATRIPRSRLLLTPACGTGTLPVARDRDVWRRLALVAAAVRAAGPWS